MIKNLSRGALALMVAIVVLSGLLFFYHLGAEPFQDYDEATYAEVVHESFVNHDFFSLHFLDVNYFRKPPLLFWTMGVSQVLVHDTQTADRIPAALAGFLSVIAVMLLVYIVTGSGYTAALAGGILLATAAFLEPSREVRFDTLAALFDTLAVYAFFKARTNQKWLIWLGVFLGLATFAKGPLVLYAIASIVAAVANLGEWKLFKSRYTWGGILAIISILLPWHLYETITYGWSFWHEYVGVQVLDRVAGPLFVVSTTNTGYFSFLAWSAAPWSELFVMSLCIFPFLYTRMSRELRAGYIASIAGVASVLAICLITQTKAISYLIPLYPFLGAGIAIIGYALIQELRTREKWAVMALAILCVVVGLNWSAYNGLHINPNYEPEVSLAWEEKGIAEYLVAAHAKTFYVYDVTTLGNIMYYSGIVQPPWLGPSSMPILGSYVLYQKSEADKVSAAYPSVQFVPVVSGSVLTLAEVRAR